MFNLHPSDVGITILRDGRQNIMFAHHIPTKFEVFLKYECEDAKAKAILYKKIDNYLAKMRVKMK